MSSVGGLILQWGSSIKVSIDVLSQPDTVVIWLKNSTLKATLNKKKQTNKTWYVAFCKFQSGYIRCSSGIQWGRKDLTVQKNGKQCWSWSSLIWVYTVCPDLSVWILSTIRVGRAKRICYLSPMRAAKVQASLRIRAVSPEPSLLAHTNSESRGTFRQKARSLPPLNGWACAVEICHDGMLEDTNSLDAAQGSIVLGLIPSWFSFQSGNIRCSSGIRGRKKDLNVQYCGCYNVSRVSHRRLS